MVSGITPRTGRRSGLQWRNMHVGAGCPVTGPSLVRGTPRLPFSNKCRKATLFAVSFPPQISCASRPFSVVRDRWLQVVGSLLLLPVDITDVDGNRTRSWRDHATASIFPIDTYCVFTIDINKMKIKSYLLRVHLCERVLDVLAQPVSVFALFKIHR